jgi:hypothetical protein
MTSLSIKANPNPYSHSYDIGTTSINYFAFAKAGSKRMVDFKPGGAGNSTTSGLKNKSGLSSSGIKSSARPEMYLVDLPGYGFAKKGKHEMKKWYVSLPFPCPSIQFHCSAQFFFPQPHV